MGMNAYGLTKDPKWATRMRLGRTHMTAIPQVTLLETKHGMGVMGSTIMGQSFIIQGNNNDPEESPRISELAHGPV